VHHMSPPGRPLVSVATARAVPPIYRPVSGSEFAEHASDTEPGTRLLILLDEGANGDFQLDLLTRREVVPARRCQVLHQVRSIPGRDAVGHDLRVGAQRPLRSPNDDPPQPQTSAAGGSADDPVPRGSRPPSRPRPL
jgi:hypothetical protein